MKAMVASALVGAMVLVGCSSMPKLEEGAVDSMSNKEKAVALLESFNNRDKQALEAISDEQYIQHSLGVKDGKEAVEAFYKFPMSLFPLSANVVRAFEDGDYVFTHTEYNLGGKQVGFDVFRFEDGLIVEHWDNLQDLAKESVNGNTQTDGPTVATDLDKTEENRALVRSLIQDVFIGGDFMKFPTYFDGDNYIQHNPNVPNGISWMMEPGAMDNGPSFKYTTLHKVLAEGDFVLAMTEGEMNGEPTAFYDLFRVENGFIAEHWDTIEVIPPQDEWKNDNGKF